MTKTEQRLGWIYYFIQLLVLPNLIVLGNALLRTPFSATELNCLFFCLNFLFIGIIFRCFLLDSGIVLFSSPFVCLRGAVIGFLAYNILSFLIQFVILTVRPDFFNVNDSYIGGMAQENFRFIAFGTIVLVPVTEEVLYRGLIFGQLHRRNRLAAYVISTIIFAAIHIVSYIDISDPLLLILNFIQYLPAGFCLAWAYEHADTIWAPILMHITINQIGMYSMR